VKLTWARERDTHAAHLIAVDAQAEWVTYEAVGVSIERKTAAALRQLGWKPPRDNSIEERTVQGYVGLCNIAFQPRKTECIERRCKQCIAKLQEIAAAAG